MLYSIKPTKTTSILAYNLVYFKDISSLLHTSKCYVSVHYILDKTIKIII